MTLKGMTISDGDANEILLARRALTVLHSNYPNYAWTVNIDGGVMKVENASLHGNKPWGFVLHLKQLVNDPHLREVRTAGGEILERYRISRQRKATYAAASEEIRDQYTDATKRLKPEF